MKAGYKGGVDSLKGIAMSRYSDFANRLNVDDGVTVLEVEVQAQSGCKKMMCVER